VHYVEDEDICTLAQSNIAVYAVFSACTVPVLYDHEEFIAADDGLSELVYRFLDPLGSNFRSRNNVMRQLWWGDTVHSKSAPTPPEVGILMLLLSGSFFRLAEKLRRRIQLQSIRDTQLSLTATVCERFRLERTAEFQGTITEFFVEHRSVLVRGRWSFSPGREAEMVVQIFCDCFAMARGGSGWKKKVGIYAYPEVVDALLNVREYLYCSSCWTSA
jgi:hypothetical protein